MKKKKTNKTLAEAMDMSFRSPQQQLWEYLTGSERSKVREAFRRIKNRDQQDLCYGLLAFLKYGIVRSFNSPFMQTLFIGFIDLIESRYMKRNHENDNKNENPKEEKDERV